MLEWVLWVIAVVVVPLLVLWVAVPALTGLPWVPSQPMRIRKALELAELQAGECLVDMGAGDGRVLIAAASGFGAYAEGIEIGPLHCLIAWIRAILAGVKSRVRVRWGNMYRADLSQADVVFLYVRQKHAGRFKSLLGEKLKDGARVVSVNVDFEGWQPAAVDLDDLLFLYVMPPEDGSLEGYLTQRVMKDANNLRGCGATSEVGHTSTTERG